jgi:hypothetical protein
MPRDQSKPVRFTVDLPGDMHYRLRMTAIQNGVHASAIVRDLIEQWMHGTPADADALRAAHAAGVQAERKRILSAVTGAVEASGR